MNQTILERCLHAQQEITSFKELRTLATTSDTLRTRSAQLEEATRKLRPLLTKWRLFKASGIAVKMPAGVSKLNGDFTALRDAFAQKPELLGTVTNKVTFDLAANFANDLQSELQTAWKRYVTEKRPEVDQNVLNVFRELPRCQGIVYDIEELLRQLDEKRDSLPVGADGIAVIGTLVGQIDTKWASLGGEGVPDSVIKFVRLAGLKNAGRSVGAQLHHLDEARVWLKKNGLEDSFRVVISG